MAHSLATAASIDKVKLADLDLNDEVKALLVHSSEKENEEKKQKALKSIRKLLNISEQYSNFCNDKLKKVLQQSEQERVENMMKQKKSKEDLKIHYFRGVLKDYQVVGVQWMKTLFEHGVNGILADEMGLGKTVQVIALICDLIDKIGGPYLIVVPLSTLPNWVSEFQRFAPIIPVVQFHGSKEERSGLIEDVLKFYTLKSGGNKKVRPVVLTTTYMLKSEIRIFTKITWKYLIVDEGQCLKNHESDISKCMRSLTCLNKLILTGTPLQNNLTELWSLLNFLMPNIFHNVDTFSSLFVLEDFHDNSKIVKDEQNTNVISSLHKIIQPFMLRRLKCDVLKDIVPKKEVIVYCPLTDLQRTLYMYTIKKNILGLQGKKEVEQNDEWLDTPRPKRKCTANKKYCDENSDDEFIADTVSEAEKLLNENIGEDKVNFLSRLTMQSPLSMFKKIVNHPYLVHTPLAPDQKHLLVDERIVSESGKMLVLDIMLSKLKKRGHKVLIFSTLVIMLDLIEEYLIMRDYKYCRLDGHDRWRTRKESIDNFNADPSITIFIISTRAGGLGLNLIGADTVIIYDRDWNPQADIQAQDRCHRIGQTKPVVVYSLITKNTVDDKILYYANMKMKLEKVVIKGGKFKNVGKSRDDAELDLEELLKMLESDDSALVVHQNRDIFSAAEWNKLMDRSDLYEQMEKQNIKNRNDDEN